MNIQILNLDGSLLRQRALLAQYGPAILAADSWGPRIRLGCALGRFRRFQRFLSSGPGPERGAGPVLTLYGSGDFHHVSLALLRRLATPFNLLILDNHPDWMRGVPFLHCGTWVYHAARLPQVRRIFHVGGDVDFDNYYRWMAPWRWLRERKIVVFPGRRKYLRGSWAGVHNEPVRAQADQPAEEEHLEKLLLPFRRELAACSLYISLDKDVMTQREAVVNWDSGHLSLGEMKGILRAFLRAACGNLAGMDVVGDWSPVHLRGMLRRFLHWTEHPALTVDEAEATRRNERTNLQLLEAVQALTQQPIRAA